MSTLSATMRLGVHRHSSRSLHPSIISEFAAATRKLATDPPSDRINFGLRSSSIFQFSNLPLISPIHFRCCLLAFLKPLSTCFESTPKPTPAERVGGEFIIRETWNGSLQSLRKWRYLLQSAQIFGLFKDVIGSSSM
ncbi:hypothetical protein N7G274_000405 [Stereocaulon virgatum]|uniref:Uncharacterized protein n=1 Tax=Stereocaulon virgatum TaxID=373712 RepID=A0ABR4AS29_9LECA